MQHKKLLLNESNNTLLLSKQALVIFANRESVLVLKETFEAAVAAAVDEYENIKIDILINGNPKLVGDFKKFLLSFKNTNRILVRLWSIDFGDKANAWNQYIHEIWSDEEIVFFLDGYVRLKSDAIVLLGKSVNANEFILAGSGVPSVGKKAFKFAEKMKMEGGFHGNFCCIKKPALSEIKNRSIKIPIGMYRVDSFMGGMLSFGLDARDGNWDVKRIFVHGSATWGNDIKRWWVWKDIKQKWKQKIRQARGIAENKSVTFLLKKKNIPFEKLPNTVEKLIKTWIQHDSSGCKNFLRKNPLVWYAINKNIPNFPAGKEFYLPEIVVEIPL